MIQFNCVLGMVRLNKHPVLTLLVMMGGPGVVFLSILPQRSGEGKAVTQPYTKGGARYAK